MRTYIIKEYIEQGAMLTRCTDWEQAKRLFIKLQEKGAHATLYFYNDKGKLQVEDISMPKFDAPSFNHIDKGDFNDHSGLMEHSTMERAYSKRGRLA